MSQAENPTERRTALANNLRSTRAAKALQEKRLNEADERVTATGNRLLALREQYTTLYNELEGGDTSEELVDRLNQAVAKLEATSEQLQKAKSEQGLARRLYTDACEEEQKILHLLKKYLPATFLLQETT